MHSTHIDIPTNATPQAVAQLTAAAELGTPTWLVVYADASVPLQALAEALAQRFPGVPMLGCTSFQGVFTQAGFKRGAAILAGEAADGIELVAAMADGAEGQGRETARGLCERLRAQLQEPDLVLMHASPGAEEELLLGVADGFGKSVPVFGGSAADDDSAGNWKVLCNGQVASRGVVLAAMKSSGVISGAFVGGYLPSDHSATVTNVRGRVIYELDHMPAAAVYNRWTNGAIEKQLADGGSVLAETSLLPLARTVEASSILPRRLLSHPERVLASSQALSFFSEFKKGDRVQLMTNTEQGLIPRMKRATEQAASARKSQAAIRGGLFVYCAGCLGTTLDRASEVGEQFTAVAGDVPFVGVSTFGEQGSFFPRSQNYHGNLMCSAVVFR